MAMMILAISSDEFDYFTYHTHSYILIHTTCTEHNVRKNSVLSRLD